MSGPDLLGALSSGADPASLGGPRPASAAEAKGGDAAGPAAVICSRRGCRADAVWALEWNNPRVHAPERVKTWTACEDHREHLADFLAARGFLRRVRPLEEAPEAAGDAHDPDSPASDAAAPTPEDLP